MSAPITYVVLIGERAIATAPSLAVAQAYALERGKQYRASSEYRWDEHRTNEWRLMSRSEGRGRFAWTQYWIAAVPALDDPEIRA